jgi:hypothetical protein
MYATAPTSSTLCRASSSIPPPHTQSQAAKPHIHTTTPMNSPGARCAVPAAASKVWPAVGPVHGSAGTPTGPAAAAPLTTGGARVCCCCPPTGQRPR